MWCDAVLRSLSQRSGRHICVRYSSYMYHPAFCALQETVLGLWNFMRTRRRTPSYADSKQRQTHAIELGSNSQSRLSKQKLNRSRASLEAAKPTLRTHRPTAANCISVVTSSLADSKSTWIRPDLAGGVVACLPHVLIRCIWVASRAASGPASRALSAMPTTIATAPVFDDIV